MKPVFSRDLPKIIELKYFALNPQGDRMVFLFRSGAPRNLTLIGFCFLLGMFFPLKAGALVLEEADVINGILRQNLVVLSRYYDPQIAATLITEAKSQFDTQIGGVVSYQLDQSDKPNIVLGTDNRVIIYEAEASKKIPYGVQGSIGLSNQRETTNSAFATDPEFFETILSFGVRAPFLKNRFGKSDRGRVSLAKTQKEVSTQDALASVEDQVYQALTNYWTLVAAQDFLKVGYRFLKMAQDFLMVTQHKKILGLSEDPDILAAQAQVEERNVEILRAKNLIKDLQEEMANRLDLRSSDPLETKDALAFVPHAFTREEGLQIALSRRNDYLALLTEAKAKDIEISIAKDQKWPSLDLLTSLELNSVDPSYGTVLGQTFSGQNPNWTVGVDFNLFFENRLARSVLTRTQLERARLLLGIKDLENRIVLEIDESMRELQLQKDERKKFTQISDLERKKLDIENKNYFLGRSSSDIITRFQNDYLDAEKNRLEALLREKLAWLDLRRSISTLIPLEQKKIPSETR